MTGEWLSLAASACVVAGVALDRFIHPGRKRLARLEEFLNDWNGEPERRTPDGAHVLEQRRPGHPERMANVEADVANIRLKLNGGGLGTQMAELSERFTDHVAQAQATREDVTDDIRAVKDQVNEIQRFSFRLAQGQERIEAKVADVQEKVDGRLFDLEEVERTHRAVLHELGTIPGDPDPS